MEAVQTQSELPVGDEWHPVPETWWSKVVEVARFAGTADLGNLCLTMVHLTGNDVLACNDYVACRRENMHAIPDRGWNHAICAVEVLRHSHRTATHVALSGGHLFVSFGEVVVGFRHDPTANEQWKSCQKVITDYCGTFAGDTFKIDDPVLLVETIRKVVDADRYGVDRVRVFLEPRAVRVERGEHSSSVPAEWDSPPTEFDADPDALCRMLLRCDRTTFRFVRDPRPSLQAWTQSHAMLSMWVDVS